uniref:Uncharacterized protein n=1 Tax=Glossina palpalis gambiensis TaxID=67801 RepID=A0A1B0C0I5_9MUSC
MASANAYCFGALTIGIWKTGNKVKAEKIIKNIIKIVIKISVLHRNNQFNPEEQKHAETFKRKFQNTQLSVISFYEVDYSFDLPYLQNSIRESHDTLKMVVQRHLTEKSLNRIDEVFEFFTDATLLETAFKANSPYSDLMGKIVADINTAMDTGDIVLHRNNQFNPEEQKHAETFKRKFQNTQLSVISFYEVDYSFDLPYLQNSIRESHDTLKMVVQRHLTEKSLNRIDEVFEFFTDATLLETAFKANSPYSDLMGKIVADINTAMDTGDM